MYILVTDFVSVVSHNMQVNKKVVALLKIVCIMTRQFEIITMKYLLTVNSIWYIKTGENIYHNFYNGCSKILKLWNVEKKSCFCAIYIN